MLAASNSLRETYQKGEKKVNKEDYKTFDIKLNKKEKDSEKVEHSVKVFEQGTPKDFCSWYKRYLELKNDMPLETASKQIKIIRSILKGNYLEIFNNYIQEKEDSKVDEDDVENALEAVTLRAFKNDRHAYRRQVRYMRYQLIFGYENFDNFLHRLKHAVRTMKRIRVFCFCN